MATTFRQLLNRALRLTGEPLISDAVAQASDENHLIIAEMANQIKEEVEAAHNWRALRQTVTVSLAAVNSGIITEANENSRVVRVQEPLHGQEVPLAWDITDSSNPTPLWELDLPELLRRREMNPDTTTDPAYFALDNSSGDVLNLEVYPTPADTRSIKLMLIIRLDAGDSTGIDTTIKVPTRPILLGLIRYIMEERGEELGINSQFSEEKEYKALQDAISLDLTESGGLNLVPE
jgi:hypothetical protein